MLNSICKKLLQLNTTGSNPITRSHFCCFLQNPIARTISHTSLEPTSQPSLALSYLIHSCGLSPQAALSASKKIQLKTTANSDSVLSLLLDHGFTKTHITTLITKRPSFLLAKPEGNLKPKLEFLHRMGLSAPNLAEILASHPLLLERSLENHTIPLFDFLRSILLTSQNVITLLNRAPTLLYCNLFKTVVPNVEILRGLGVPEPNISILLMSSPHTLIRNPNQFAVLTAEVKQMGTDPSNLMFGHVLIAKCAVSKSTWERKVAVYKELGFSEDEIRLALRKQPKFIQVSEEKIRRQMDFLLNKLKLRPANVLAYPTLITLSLEKTIAPRCSVLNILMLNGVIKRDVNIARLLTLSKACFLDAFVTKYQKEVPEVLEAYQGNINFIGFEMGSQNL